MSGPKRREALRLERVIGLSCDGSPTLAAISDDTILYTAGALVVRYDVKSNSQRAFYRTKKPISCITVSADAKYLAAGERGHMPNVVIWEISTGQVLANLSGHTQGVGCISFSPDANILVSVGFKFDKQLLVWDWRENTVLSAQKVVRCVVETLSFLFEYRETKSTK